MSSKVLQTSIGCFWNKRTLEKSERTKAQGKGKNFAGNIVKPGYVVVKLTGIIQSVGLLLTIPGSYLVFMSLVNCFMK